MRSGSTIHVPGDGDLDGRIGQRQERRLRGRAAEILADGDRRPHRLDPRAIGQARGTGNRIDRHRTGGVIVDLPARVAQRVEHVLPEVLRVAGLLGRGGVGRIREHGARLALVQLRDRLGQGTRQRQGLAAAAAAPAADAGARGEQLARVQAGHEQRSEQGQHDGGEPDPAARRGQRPGIRPRPSPAARARRTRAPVPVEPLPVIEGSVVVGPAVPRRRPPQRDQAAPDPDPFPPVGAEHGQVAHPAQAEHHDGGELVVRGVHGDRHGEQDEQRQPGQRGGPQPHRDEVGQHRGDAHPCGG